MTPEKFAPGVVSTDAIELNGVFTPDGREFFFTRRVDGVHTMHHSVFARRVGASWETTTAGDVYWVDAKVLDAFRPARDR